jgi:hypothetical protein
MSEGDQRHALGALPWTIDPVSIVEMGGRAPEPSRRLRNISPVTAFDPPTVPHVPSRYADWTFLAQWLLRPYITAILIRKTEISQLNCYVISAASKYGLERLPNIYYCLKPAQIYQLLNNTYLSFSCLLIQIFNKLDLFLMVAAEVTSTWHTYPWYNSELEIQIRTKNTSTTNWVAQEPISKFYT